MAYTGQPVPSTVYNAVRAKISDGKSVRVEVPENTTVEAGKFYLLGGFFGAAMQSVTTGAGETAEVILNIEPAEFETDQTKEADRASMTVGKDNSAVPL
jgi:predicted RecA/RadA family phage recombinase